MWAGANAAPPDQGGGARTGHRRTPRGRDRRRRLLEGITMVLLLTGEDDFNALASAMLRGNVDGPVYRLRPGLPSHGVVAPYTGAEALFGAELTRPASPAVPGRCAYRARPATRSAACRVRGALRDPGRRPARPGHRAEHAGPGGRGQHRFLDPHPRGPQPAPPTGGRPRCTPAPRPASTGPRARARADTIMNRSPSPSPWIQTGPTTNSSPLSLPVLRYPSSVPSYSISNSTFQ